MGLTDKQTKVLYQIVSDIRGGKSQVILGGYAGTGKTTLAKYITRFFPKFGVCAFTGKAANVLRKKGMESARTIHSLIYRPVLEYGRLIGFDLADSEELGCEGFVVDEGSMVSEEIYEDLLSYNLPLIVIGDHGQLEPVNSSFNLMERTDYKLEEIHRNAGRIAQFAEHLRFGRRSTKYPECEEVEFRSQRSIASEDFLEVDQVICAYNRTRVETNAIIREALGYDKLLHIGERIMCLRNNKTKGVFNGMQGIVLDLYNDARTGRQMMRFESNGEIYEDIWYDSRCFGQEKAQTDYFGTDNPIPFDYAYCITAHKAQGDEWPKVMVIEQKCKNWDHKRWAYTAASRAKEKIIWAY